MWWRSIKELLNGKAFTPDETDIGFPFGVRMQGKSLLVVQQKSQSILCRVVRQQRDRIWKVIHAEDITCDVDLMRSCWMRLQIDLKVEHAAWVDDGEWEVQESRMRWNGSGYDLQNAMALGGIIPVDENEKGRCYSPVATPSGEVLSFSVRRHRMDTAIALLQECGYRIVRTGILMAMVCRYLMPKILSPDISPKYWLIVSSGSLLMLYQSSGQLKQIGQWCGEDDSRAGLYELWSSRMKDSLADVHWVLVDVESPSYEFLDRRSAYQQIRVSAGELPVVQWDPDRDIQPELRQEIPEIRPCLSAHWKMAWRGVLMAYIGLFAWWGYELWQGRQLMLEMQSLGYEEDRVRQRLNEMRMEGKGLFDEQERARRIGSWVRSLIHTPQLVPVLTSILPNGIKIRDFTLRLFDGQRQVELIVEMVGVPQLLSQASPLLIRGLEESGFQMVSLDQSEYGDGIRFRGIFLHAPRL
jgi:hypothetical protein